jgi:hypothetical protein
MTLPCGLCFERPEERESRLRGCQHWSREPTGVGFWSQRSIYVLVTVHAINTIGWGVNPLLEASKKIVLIGRLCDSVEKGPCHRKEPSPDRTILVEKMYSRYFFVELLDSDFRNPSRLCYPAVGFSV